MPTKINYVDETWNPVTGCTKCSPGCLHCYAEAISKRFWKGRKFSDVQCHEERLNIPLGWHNPRRILVPSMGDLFHPKVPFEFIHELWDIMKKCPQHKFLLLTKRVKRMAQFFSGWCDYPYPENIWPGASICNQEEADKIIPILLHIPGKHWISFEPLLEGIDARRQLLGKCGYYCDERVGHIDHTYIDFAVIGCESGPGRRPCKREWIESLYHQCKTAGVEVMIKQMEINGKVCHDHAENERRLRDFC